MRYVKRMRTALIAVILVAPLIHCAGESACAAPREKIDLTPPPDSPFPNASGWAVVKYAGPFWYYYWGGRYKYFVNAIECEVSGLAPNTWYRVYRDAVGAGYIVTDENGDGGFGNSSEGRKWEPGVIYVCDDATGVVVLSSKR